MLKNLEVRKLVTMMLVVAFIVFVGVEMFLKVAIPTAFTAAVMLTLGYYFGKSTALDKPQE